MNWLERYRYLYLDYYVFLLFKLLIGLILRQVAELTGISAENLTFSKSGWVIFGIYHTYDMRWFTSTDESWELPTLEDGALIHYKLVIIFFFK